MLDKLECMMYLKNCSDHCNEFILYQPYYVAGSILEGPDPTKLRTVVEQAMPTLINALKDSSVVVRDTTAWTLGRVCELSPEAAVNETYLNVLLEALVLSLKVS